MESAHPSTGSGAAAGTNLVLRRTSGPGPLEMVLVAGLAFFLNLSAGILLQMAHPRLGLLLSEIFFIAAPAVLAMRLFYLDRSVILPLRGVRWMHLIAGIAGALALNHLLTIAGAWQETVWPTPVQVQALFDGLFVYRGALDFTALLVAFALVPAICEEILFRGFLQAGLARAIDHPAGVVAASALVFAVFHLDPWRFTGIMGLGLFLAWLRLRTGSLLPPMAAHAASNVLAITLKATGRLDDQQPGTLWSATAAAALLIAAIAMLVARRNARDRML
jgi:membrane protease YdiL (CAAX protease family)